MIIIDFAEKNRIMLKMMKKIPIDIIIEEEKQKRKEQAEAERILRGEG